MKNLIILRHADAAEKLPGSSDFERRLSEQGKQQARSQGRLLRLVGINFERVVASAAVRTLETSAVMMDEARFSGEVEAVEALYNAPGDVLLEFIRGLPNGFSTLLLVAHLPGVAQLLSALTTEHGDLEQIFSPATMALVQVEGESWQDLDYGVGSLALFLPPILPLT